LHNNVAAGIHRYTGFPGDLPGCQGLGDRHEKVAAMFLLLYPWVYVGSFHFRWWDIITLKA
jgi:hypothetical protein